MGKLLVNLFFTEREVTGKVSALATDPRELLTYIRQRRNLKLQKNVMK